MRKIGLLVLVLAILAGSLYYLILKKAEAAEDDFSTWKEFTPLSGFFRVVLPYYPQYAKDIINIPNKGIKLRYDMYASEKIDGTLFLISVITYPNTIDPASSDEILHFTLEELLNTRTNNHLAHTEKGLFQKYPALSFSFDNTSFHIEGKIIIKDQQVFVLTYTTPKNEFDAVEYKQFIDSFTFTNEEKIG